MQVQLPSGSLTQKVQLPNKSSEQKVRSSAKELEKLAYCLSYTNIDRLREKDLETMVMNFGLGGSGYHRHALIKMLKSHLTEKYNHCYHNPGENYERWDGRCAAFCYSSGVRCGKRCNRRVSKVDKICSLHIPQYPSAQEELSPPYAPESPAEDFKRNVDREDESSESLDHDVGDVNEDESSDQGNEDDLKGETLLLEARVPVEAKVSDSLVTREEMNKMEENMKEYTDQKINTLAETLNRLIEGLKPANVPSTIYEEDHITREEVLSFIVFMFFMWMFIYFS